MKSIKNQYIDLKEGKMTEAQFMRNVRMTLPQYVSNVTLFKQAEKILINKGIISEVKVNEVLTPADEMELENIVAKYVKDADDVSREMDAYSEKGFRGFSDLVQANLNRDDEFQSWVQRTSDEEQYRRETGDMPGFEGTLDALDKISIKEAKEGYYNQDGKEQYGKFDEIDNMNGQEIMAGYVIEKLENPDKDKVEIAKILIKNLKSDPYYYTNYKLTGIRGEKPSEFTSTKRKSGFDQMEEVDKNGNNFVDEKNKMTVIKEGLEEAKEYPAELSVDNITNIIKDNYHWYREDKTKVEKLSTGEIYLYVYGRLVGDAREILDNLFNVREEAEEVDDEREPVYTYFISPKSELNEEIATIGNPSFGGKTKKVKVGDKAKLQGQEVTITKIDYVKPGSGATSNKIIAKTKDGEQVSAKAVMYEPLDEATKGKLKSLVRKMMKEMFDGRDNVTDVTGEND